MAPEKTRIIKMFDDISPRYDFLNHFLSFGIDHCWRKKVTRILKRENPSNLLDVATGTGDLALALSKLKIHSITGIDISPNMLMIAKEKIKRKSPDSPVDLREGDAEHIPFPDDRFDAATVAFGVRNFENLEAGIREMRRVIRPEGMVVILEFSQPENPFFRSLYKLYSKFYIPAAGKWISGNSHAYCYLPESAALFPSGEKFLGILTRCGFKDCKLKKLSFGIATIYTGRK
ncbi:MAG: bifunctional demethylmenaquinone methyltransferase/2-methoxy-6-polyprenyl-1,4-benzoquinol methylase UbiE [Bacteroidota bacterium]|nr:bifunctional demethylmenaquinone methyltransferase/2-methoxy-6-polyprenyl-1,4-benzoquinol methylase UbiE [Bacteroidota bacterium]